MSVKQFVYFLTSCAYLHVLLQESMGVACNFQQTHHVTFSKSGNMGPQILGKGWWVCTVRHFTDNAEGWLTVWSGLKSPKRCSLSSAWLQCPELRTRPGEVLRMDVSSDGPGRPRPWVSRCLSFGPFPQASFIVVKERSLVSHCYLHSLSLCFLQVPETSSRSGLTGLRLESCDSGIRYLRSPRRRSRGSALGRIPARALGGSPHFPSELLFFLLLLFLFPSLHIRKQLPPPEPAFVVV